MNKIISVQKQWPRFGKQHWRIFITEGISILIVLLFIYTAINKFMDFATFRLQLGQSPFIVEYADWVAWTIPTAEILIALLMIIRKYRLLGFYATLFLMTMFTSYIYLMLKYSYDLPCSCGGIIGEMTWVQHFWFNIVFIVFSMVGIVLEVLRQRATAQ